MAIEKDKITDADLRKSVRGALRKVHKMIHDEPTTLIIEPNATRVGISEETLDEIRKWLFRKR